MASVALFLSSYGDNRILLIIRPIFIDAHFMNFATKLFDKMALKLSRSLLCLVVLVSMLVTLTVKASQDELKGVTSEISRQKESVNNQQKELNKLQQSLKEQELSISNLSTEIKQTESNLAKADKNLAQFNQQKLTLEQKKSEQEKTLAELITTYYLTKRNNEAKAMLNQENNQHQDRISQYFQHLAQARAEAIEQLSLTSQQLEEKNAQLIQEQEEIKALLAQKTKKRDELASSKKQRTQTINKIKSNISSDQRYLEELQRNEARLRAEIAKAVKRNAVPMDGLAKQQGKLPWPIKGKTLHKYGEKQSGQVSWKGIVIDAKHEQPVKAVHSGTVVFAEYLRGYGLVVLLDHGKGDMTLYGYNQTLLKIEGDKVSAGETIALAGNSGGQPQTALYFEIRRNSKTQNPSTWLVK